MLRNNKLRRAYNIGGMRFAILTLIANVCRKMEGSIIGIINSILYTDKTEVVKKINNYSLILNTRDKGIHKQLLTNGDRELLSTRAMQQEVRKDDVILEAGANIGYYAILEGTMLGKNGKIYAVEPSRKNYSDLKRNIKLNRLKNIETYNFAFGEKEDVVKFGISDKCNMNLVTERMSPKLNESDKVRMFNSFERVKMMSVDDFLRGKRKPDIVRMDVEGYEYEIIRGMKKLLKNHPPRILYIETHPWSMGEKKLTEFLTSLKGHGYEIKHAFLYETATSKISFLNYLDSKRFKILLNKKLTIDELLHGEFGKEVRTSIEIFFEHKNHIKV